MPLSDSQRKANKKYLDENWSQVKLSMPNEEAAALRQYCADHGLTVAGFIRGLVRDALASVAVPSWLPGVATRGGSGGAAGGGVTPPNSRKEEKGE